MQTIIVPCSQQNFALADRVYFYSWVLNFVVIDTVIMHWDVFRTQ